MAKQNTAQYLRDYIKIKQAQISCNVEQLKKMVLASNLKLDEAGRFFEVLNQMEQENFKIKE